MNKNIGLIGIGLVGSALAELLIEKGFNVIGYDINEDRLAFLSSIGGVVASSPKDVAAMARRMILSLLTSEVVETVIEGENGVLAAKKKPRFIIDTTTSDPERVVKMAAKLQEKGIYFLDSPIAGSSKQIRNMQGVVVVGGSETAFKSCIDIFNAISRKHIYLGPSGSGSKAKLAINLVLGLNRAVLAEGLVFAEAIGLDQNLMLELFSITPAYSKAIDSKGKKMVNGDFEPDARLFQHLKDVNLILKLANGAGLHLPFSSTHRDVLNDAMLAGDGELDNSAIIKEIKRRWTKNRRETKKFDARKFRHA
ncbi:MAG: NAD(P)-dependent oxidoreductase [Promethearchaeota archaeon]